MSWLNLRRLLPAGKAWRVFTAKLQRKLHKLHRSKAIKKPKILQLKTTTKAVPWPSLSLQSRLKHKRRITQPAHSFRHRRYYLQKRLPPVYINELLVEHASASVRLKEHLQTTTIAAAAATKGETEKCPPSAKENKLVGQQTSLPAQSSKEDQNSVRNHIADDMWESLTLASPQMHGINERAEEFITRFRAEMQLQEMLTRHL